jgi:hypothetical protein
MINVMTTQVGFGSVNGFIGQLHALLTIHIGSIVNSQSTVHYSTH